MLRRGSFTLPPSVLKATERFKMEADPLRGFIEERIVFVDAFTARSDIYGAYSAWAAINGFHSMSTSRFYESFTSAATDMSKQPVRFTVRDGTRGYKGLAIK